MQLTELILRELGKPLSLDPLCQRPTRPRPALRTRRHQDLRGAGLAAGAHFDDALRATIAWYRDNDSWWQHVKSGEYRTYYQRMYGERSARCAAAEAAS